MDDFDRRLAARLTAYEESVPAATTPAATGGRVTRSRPGSALLLIPAALVVVMGVVFGIAGSGLLTGARPVGSGPVTSLEWTTHPFAPGARILALTAVGDRLIATGSLNDKAAAWYSDDDGETWTGAPVETPKRPGDSNIVATHALADVAEHGNLLVALDAYTVGLAEGLPASTTIHTEVWISDDRGASWKSAPGIDASTTSVTASEHGFVSVGIGPSDIRTSQDGVDWRKVNVVGIDATAMLTDAAFGHGNLSIVGSLPAVDRTRGTPVPTIWVSSDDMQWAATRLGQDSSGTPRQVAIGPSSTVAVGGAISAGDQDASQRPVVWMQTPSGTWSERFLPPGPPDNASAAAATNVASNSLGTVVGIRRFTTANSPGDQLWFLPTADSTHAVEQGLHLQVSALAALPDAFVMVSQCGASGDCEVPTVSVGKASLGTTAKPVATPVATASSRTAPSPTPTGHVVGPTARPSVSGLVFVDPGEIGSVSSVASSSNGWVAVGTAKGEPGIWHSADGSAWQRIRSLPAIPNAPTDATVMVHDIIATASGFVAVGAVSTAVDYSRPFAWFSSDGRSWASANLPGSDGCGSAQSVTKTGSGELVAAGRTCGPSATGSAETDSATIWTSHDGATWRVVSVADAAGGDIDDVALTTDGFVAVGSVRDGSSIRPRVWESSEGEKWEATWTGSQEGALRSVTDLDNLVVAGGVLGDNTTQMLPGVWVRTSRDQWAGRDVMGGECCGDIASVAAGSGQLFALDQAFVFDGTNRRTIVLTSRDGADWQTFELPDSFTGSALSIAPDGRLLALGSALSDGDVPAPAIFAVASSSSATSLTRPEAIAAAREFALLGESTKVLAADQGPFRQFDPSPNPKASSPPPDTLVWRVIFETGDSGQIRIVTLDAHSGELIETMAAIAN